MNSQITKITQFQHVFNDQFCYYGEIQVQGNYEKFTIRHHIKDNEFFVQETKWMNMKRPFNDLLVTMALRKVEIDLHEQMENYYGVPIEFSSIRK